MKKERLFIFWFMAIIIASVLLVFLKPQETINNIIQAIAIITLVFVTWVYAKRTKDLVEQEKISLEEQKKKRTIDFWEKRINEFYKPFIDKLNTMRREINKDTVDKKITENILKDVEDFYWKRRYMISIDTFKKIDELHTKLFIASIDIAQLSNDEAEKLLKDFRMAESKVRDIIIMEWENIENSIRKFYGY